MHEIRVVEKDRKLDHLRYTGDWTDVRVSAISDLTAKSEQIESDRQFLQRAQTLKVKQGDTVKIAHGFALELPAGHEAILLPRSSTFSLTGLIFASSGVIDEGYNGDGDEWFSVWYATRDCELMYDQRIAQFRIQQKQPELEFQYVPYLGNKDRGGHGSTGVK